MVTPDSPRSLRADTQTIRTWLDRLDRSSGERGKPDHRRSRRFSYRPGALAIQVMQGGEPHTAYVAACRNVSREGLGLIVGQFLYPGAACRATLPSPYGCDQSVAGHVARCRYLVGSAVLHEVGVVFDRPIDITLLAPHGRLLHVLLVDDSEATHELVGRLLGNRHVDLASASAEPDAIRAASQWEFDLILIDLESPSFDGLAIVQQIRGRGFVGPIIGLTVQAGSDLRAQCAAAGCTGYLTKPITREELLDLIDALLDPPLVSTLAGDADMEPLVNGFVAGLRDKVAQLSIAKEIGDFDTLQTVVQGLRAEAGSYGFEVISRRAAYLEALLVADESSTSIGPALRRLMHVCLKARPAVSPPEAAIVPYGRLTGGRRAR